MDNETEVRLRNAVDLAGAMFRETDTYSTLNTLCVTDVLNTLTQVVYALAQRVEEMDDALADVIADQKAFDNRLDDVEAFDSRLDDVEALEPMLDDVRRDLDTAESDIEELRNDLSQLESNQSDTDDEISTLDSRIDDLESA